MKKILGVSLISLLGAAACSRHAPTDAQLVALFGTARAGAADTGAPLDGNSIDCLRNLSNDPELAKDLPPAFSGEPGKRGCPHLLESRISDAQRNPDKLVAADVTAPAVVRRVMALQSQRRLAALDASGSHQPPAALTNPVPPPPAAPSEVDLGPAGEKLKEAEDLCLQVQRRVAAKDDVRLRGFANFCGTTLKRTRASMEIVAKKGNQAHLEELGTVAGNLANNARRLLNDPPK